MWNKLFGHVIWLILASCTCTGGVQLETGLVNRLMLVLRTCTRGVQSWADLINVRRVHRMFVLTVGLRVRSNFIFSYIFIIGIISSGAASSSLLSHMSWWSIRFYIIVFFQFGYSLFLLQHFVARLRVVETFLLLLSGVYFIIVLFW